MTTIIGFDQKQDQSEPCFPAVFMRVPRACYVVAQGPWQGITSVGVLAPCHVAMAFIAPPQEKGQAPTVLVANLHKFSGKMSALMAFIEKQMPVDTTARIVLSRGWQPMGLARGIARWARETGHEISFRWGALIVDLKDGCIADPVQDYAWADPAKPLVPAQYVPGDDEAALAKMGLVAREEQGRPDLLEHMNLTDPHALRGPREVRYWSRAHGAMRSVCLGHKPPLLTIRR